MEVQCTMSMEEILSALVINWDQTAMTLVPSSSCTMEKQGTKRVEFTSIDEQRQIRAIFLLFCQVIVFTNSTRLQGNYSKMSSTNELSQELVHNLYS